MSIRMTLFFAGAVGTIALAAAGTVTSAKPPGASPESADPCRQGRAWSAAGDVVKAAKALARCVEREPRNREAWTALANAELEAGRFGPSADAFARAEDLKPGDEAFLSAYLSALDGAGRIEERIPVLRKLAGGKAHDRAAAGRLLAEVEASGPDRHPEEYLFALQALSEGPKAERYHLEKLAAAYLKMGDTEKAEAEYRGLLERFPESAESWAGLGAALAAGDPPAASECYRKAALYSNQAGQRAGYLAERDRLAKAAPAAKPGRSPDEEEAVLAAALSAPAPSAAETAPVARARAAPGAASTNASSAKTANAIAASAAADSKTPAASKPAAGLDLQAYQDSVYKAELARRLKAMHIDKSVLASMEAEAGSSAAGGTRSAEERRAQDEKSKRDDEARKHGEAEKERLAKAGQAKKMAEQSERARRDSLAAAEAEAAEEEARQEKAAKAERSRRDSIAAADLKRANEEKDRRESMAKAEQARRDSVREADGKKAKEEKARQEALAKAEKARRDSVEKAEAFRAKEEKARREALAKAEKASRDSAAKAEELKAEAEKARQEALARAERALKDSLAREAEARAVAEKARRDSLARVEKDRKDSLSRVAEAKAKADKARQDSLARVAERKAREEKERLERERLARERRDRFERACAQYRAGRLDSAALSFKAVLADSPSAEAWYYAGRVQLDKSEFARASEYLAKAPGDRPDLDGLKGKAWLGQGRHKEALQALQSQYARDRNDSLLEAIVGLKRRLGDEAGAIASLEELAGRRPGSIRFQAELAAYWRGKGDRGKASERYSRVFILDPRDGEANYWLGMEAWRAGDASRAASMLERALAVFPGRADAWKALALADLALGRKDASWEAHRKALALAPDDPELARGRLELALESHPDSLGPAYETVLRLAPTDAGAAMGLARLRYLQGDFAAAEKAFRIALKESKDARAWAEFGRSLLEQGKTDEAAATLQKAVDLGEKDASVRLDLARIRMEKGDLDWAEALVKELAKKSPSDPEAQYWLGRIAAKRQQTQVAEEFYRKAHQLRPANGRYAEALAQGLKEKDEFKPAVAVLAQAEPSLTPAGRLLFGDCLARAGEGAKALDVYAASYKKEPSAQTLARRMELLTRLGRSGEAAAIAAGSPFAGSTEVRFALAKAQLDLAESHVLKGDVDQAVDLMKQVLKTDRHKPEYHYYLGLGYFAQGRWKKAKGEFDDALGFRAEYPDALYRKGMCLIKLEDAKDAENVFKELSLHAESAWKARGLYGLALVFQAQGKHEAVRHHLELSAAAAPSPDALAALAQASLRDGKSDEAQDHARKALALAPGHEAATVALAEALAAAKQRDQAMELARAGLKAKPYSCGLLIQSAKLNLEAGKFDSSLAASNGAIQACPDEPMGYYYAGIATRSGKKPKEAKEYFKAFRKRGGDGKLVPED